jgi:nephrocystin-3
VAVWFTFFVVRVQFNFTEAEDEDVLSWIPPKLAPQIRCVVSVISGSDFHIKLMNREPAPVELTIPPLDQTSKQVDCIN